MTEAEWLACDDRQPMLETFRGRLSDRKLRLFACACCRHIWNLLTEKSRNSVSVAEQYADGIAGIAELDEACRVAYEVATSAEEEAVAIATDQDAFFAAFDASYSAAGKECFLGWPGRNENNESQVALEHVYFAGLLRDVFGNPFRPVTFEPAWRTSDVLTLARQMYASRDFSGMPILADALQDAGCDSEDILTHCRGTFLLTGEPPAGSPGPPPVPHVRGCWVVDLVLEKQ